MGGLELGTGNAVSFSQPGIHSAQHMNRKKRINPQNMGGANLSEAPDVPSVADKPQRSHTSAANNTLSGVYGNVQPAIQKLDKVRGGSINLVNQKYN